MPQCCCTALVKADQHLDVFFDVRDGLAVEIDLFVQERGVDAEVHANVAILLVRAPRQTRGRSR